MKNGLISSQIERNGKCTVLGCHNAEESLLEQEIFSYSGARNFRLFRNVEKNSPWVAWSKADREIVKTLIENRAKNKKPRSDSLSKSRNSKDYMGIDELVEVLVNDKIKFSEQNNVKPWFSLNPPKGGFKKSTKRQFSDGGTLGSNKDLLEIVKKMI